ncbi:MAG TPA: hypothetical protein VG294_07675 [Solirubrobacteraceae bacterium]|jgi:hypothetical protein|nr:hypothetical protein [Solirubrobacteraceae bacterium]
MSSFRARLTRIAVFTAALLAGSLVALVAASLSAVPTNTIATFAGTGLPCSNPGATEGSSPEPCGDQGPAAMSQFHSPVAIQAIPANQGGGYLVSDELDYRIRRIAPDGTVSSVEGAGRICAQWDSNIACDANGPAGGAFLGDSNPFGGPLIPPSGAPGVAALPSASGADAGLLIADGAAGTILMSTANQGVGTGSVASGNGGDCQGEADVGGVPTPFIPPPPASPLCGDNGPANAAKWDNPDRAVPFDGGYLVSEIQGNRVRFVNGLAPTSDVYTIAGQANGISCSGAPMAVTDCGFPNLTGGAANPPTSVYLDQPTGIAVLPSSGGSGAFLVASSNKNIVVEVFGINLALLQTNPSTAIAAAQVKIIAGDLVGDESGDGGPATSAALNRPSDVAVAGDGTIVVADAGGETIREINPSGVISTLAGTANVACAAPGATAPACGDGGAATSATFNTPEGVAIAGDGSVLVADTLENRIRCIDAGLVAPAGETPTGDPGCGQGTGFLPVTTTATTPTTTPTTTATVPTTPGTTSTGPTKTNPTVTSPPGLSLGTPSASPQRRHHKPVRGRVVLKDNARTTGHACTWRVEVMRHGAFVAVAHGSLAAGKPGGTITAVLSGTPGSTLRYKVILTDAAGSVTKTGTARIPRTPAKGHRRH